MIKSILMVCRGNICRSAMAEGYFLSQLKKNNVEVAVSSAGINALVEHPADPHAVSVMQLNHIDISKHRARQLTNELIQQSDLILVMTQLQLKTVISQYVSARGKVFLLGHWGQFEIPDPYKQSYELFEKCYQQVELAWKSWQTRIVACQIYT